MASVSAVNTFTLRQGVSLDDFEIFSRELDRPTCLALEPVESFDVYLVQADAASPVDVIEIMTVRSWPEWESVRDNAPEMKPVVERFEQLVDTTSVQTYFTRRSLDPKDG